MKTKFVYIILIIVLFSSCGIFKKTLKTDDSYDNTFIEETKVKIALDSIQKHYLEFDSFYCGFTGNYETTSQNLPLKGLLKIKADSFVWISIRPIMGIEISRILITTDSIKVIDKIKNQYIEENLKVIKTKFGFDLTYNMVQSILLNRFFVFPGENTINSYYLLKSENMSTLNATGIFSDLNISHKISISNNNNSIYENNLKILDKNQTLNILYSDFQLLNESDFPNILKLNIEDTKNISSVSLSYKNIKINDIVKPTFYIPANFKRVNFE